MIAVLSPPLQNFRDSLPKKPYCAWNFTDGIKIRNKNTAVSFSHIQPNRPEEMKWMVFDIDSPTGSIDWRSQGAPAPTIITENPKNGHAHLFYRLKTPVYTHERAKSAPIRYMEAVKEGLRILLNGDVGYVGLMAKNPLRNDLWNVQFPGETSYSLNELAEYVEDEGIKVKERSRGYADKNCGTNCLIFSNAKEKAYQDFHTFEGGEGAWHEHIRGICESKNIEEKTLPRTEINGIARSIAKWTWRNLSSSPSTKRQHLWGKRSGEIRRAKAGEKLKAVKEWMAENPGATQREISAGTKIPQTTVSRLLKLEPRTYQDTSPTATIRDLPSPLPRFTEKGITFFQERFSKNHPLRIPKLPLKGVGVSFPPAGDLNLNLNDTEEGEPVMRKKKPAKEPPFKNACARCRVPDIAPCPKVSRIYREEGTLVKFARCEWQDYFDKAIEIYANKSNRGALKELEKRRQKDGYE